MEFSTFSIAADETCMTVTKLSNYTKGISRILKGERQSM